jgi:putative flippase GtrA
MTDFARWLLRYPFIRFALVGGAGYLVDLAMLAIATEQLGLDAFRGRVLSIAVAMTATWLGNRYFTFAERRARGSFSAIAQEGLKFAGANLIGAAVNYGVYAALVAYAASPFNNLYLAQIIGVLAGLVFNFTLSRTLVFSRTPQAAEDPRKTDLQKADPQQADPQKANPKSPI